MAVRKTASELGITQREFDDLVWVRDALDSSKPEVELPKWLDFDMHQWIKGPGSRDQLSCGTAACIGGTMHIKRISEDTGTEVDHLTKKDVAINEFDHSDALDPLFFEYDVDLTRSKEAAIAAIDAFLAGSKEPWYEVSL